MINEECRNEACLNLNVKGPETIFAIKLNCTEAKHSRDLI